MVTTTGGQFRTRTVELAGTGLETGSGPKKVISNL